MKLTVIWPDSVVDLELQSKWVASKEDDHIEMYHPELIVFENLKSCGSRYIDSVESRANLGLPFQVQIDMNEKHNLA